MARLEGQRTPEGMDTGKAMRFVAEELNQRRNESMARYQAAAQTAVRDWAAKQQAHLISLALSSAARWGIRVTVELLAGLGSQLGKNRRWLEEEAANRETMPVGVSDLPVGQVIRVDAAELRSFVLAHAAVVVSVADARVLRGIADLMDDMAENLVKPLMRDLQGIHVSITSASASTHAGQPTLYARWPVGRDVPRRLRPTQNERVLLHHDTFFDELIRQLERQLSVRSEAAAIDGAISQIVLYPTDAANGEPERIAQQDWSPKAPEFRTSSAGARQAKLHLQLSLDPAATLQRVERWMRRPDTPLGRLLGESLADYLDLGKVGDLQVLQQRLDSYGRELSEAVKASAPLAAVSPAVAAVVHPGLPLEPNRIFSGFPFAPGTPAADVTEAVLRDSANLSEDARRQLLNAEHKDPYVDVFSMLGAPMEAPVFDSLMRPLSQEWDRARSSGPDGIAKFWRFRRTRPLPQFIPMAPYVQQAMVRGWFTAQLLGQVRDDESTGGLEVFVPSMDVKRGSYYALPHPLLLPQGYHASDRIAGILKTAMAALIAVNATAQLDPIMPYRRLLDLGTTRQGAIEVYGQLNQELLNWVSGAALPAGAPLPPANWSGPADGSPSQRREIMYKQVESWWHGYEERIFAPVGELEDLWEVPRAWEMRHEYTAALKDIGLALRNLALDETADDLV